MTRNTISDNYSLNYYNEIDPYAASWLRALIECGELPAGDVDERSITDVQPTDLKDYTQCHFFAGIGGWPLALRIAGWPDDRPVYTGSVPCQPFSIANKNGQASGTKDPRHLWPAFYRLIREQAPSILFGEQVPRACDEGWLDEVFRDLEAEDYACGAMVLPANAFKADHERKRLFWMAYTDCEGREGLEQVKQLPRGEGEAFAVNGNPLAHARRALDGDFRHILPCNGVSLKMERNALKGYGNAIVPEVAARFVSACADILSLCSN